MADLGAANVAAGRVVHAGPVLIRDPIGSLRDPIGSIRDRFFHSLFFKMSLVYARSFSPRVRRLIETVVLLKAIVCILMLVYMHWTLSRHTVHCVDQLKANWPQNGVLRVEVIRAPPAGYSLNHSYAKERSVHTILDQREAPFMFGLFFARDSDSSNDLDADDDEEEEEEDVERQGDVSKPNFRHAENVSSAKMPIGLKSGRPSFLSVVGPGDQGAPVCRPHPDGLPPSDALMNERPTFSFLMDYVYIVEYSLEHGLLHLTPDARQRLNISVKLVVLDPDKHPCFGDSISQFILHYLIGYEDVLMSLFKRLTEHENKEGYLRHVVTGANYHFVNQRASSIDYLASTIIMIIFTIFITMLLRFTQQQMFLFMLELLQMLEFNSPTSFPAAPLLTSLLALLGLESIMSEFFENNATAFYVILIVWIADQYDAVCCHTYLTRKYWLRFFYLYHFFYYAYHYRFGGQCSGLALLAMWGLTQHIMLYFFHHYELPMILQRAAASAETGGHGAARRVFIAGNNNNNDNLINNNNGNINNNNNNNENNEVLLNIQPLPAIRRMLSLNIAGFRLRFGIVMTSTTRVLDNRNQTANSDAQPSSSSSSSSSSSLSTAEASASSSSVEESASQVDGTSSSSSALSSASTSQVSSHEEAMSVTSSADTTDVSLTTVPEGGERLQDSRVLYTLSSSNSSAAPSSSDPDTTESDSSEEVDHLNQ